MSDRPGRTAAAVALAVGAGAAVAPGTLVRSYGVTEPLTGPGAFGWRLFASRNLAIGTAAWRGNEAARAAHVGGADRSLLGQFRRSSDSTAMVPSVEALHDHGFALTARHAHRLEADVLVV